jgi:uncharacterized protein YjiS (DUF1127 family)
VQLSLTISGPEREECEATAASSTSDAKDFETMTDTPYDNRARSLGIESWTTILMKSIKQAISRIGSERRINRKIGELMALDDRMLADIGISRSNIEYVVRHGLRR